MECWFAVPQKRHDESSTARLSLPQLRSLSGAGALWLSAALCASPQDPGGARWPRPHRCGVARCPCEATDAMLNRKRVSHIHLLSRGLADVMSSSSSRVGRDVLRGLLRACLRRSSRKRFGASVSRRAAPAKGSPSAVRGPPGSLVVILLPQAAGSSAATLPTCSRRSSSAARTPSHTTTTLSSTAA